MKISEEEVRHVANLSKLAFSDKQTSEFAESLSEIVDMVEKLNEIDTTGVPFTSNVAFDSVNFMREDVAINDCQREDLMRNVPEKENGFIKVPVIIEDGGDA